jgi:hypothetical protein
MSVLQPCTGVNSCGISRLTRVGRFTPWSLPLHKLMSVASAGNRAHLLKLSCNIFIHPWAYYPPPPSILVHLLTHVVIWKNYHMLMPQTKTSSGGCLQTMGGVIRYINSHRIIQVQKTALQFSEDLSKNTSLINSEVKFDFLILNCDHL